MAQSVHNKTVYSSIMNRWIFGASADGKKSAVFKDGYDDPTYMTFKIEFGEWGASILDRSIVQNGITEFGLSFNDYDQLPMGLLNCPYEGASNQEIYWQENVKDDYKVFNNTKLYSAFQYLRSRNEDTRAKYLFYFVNGLYEIQHDYPFIFKKVSGLNELEKFDATAGQRLKTPAKITVECYEGLDLKIRTLFEFYRKAAWDDVYQRWILPENMREFKMIIYVFERRIFQDTQMFSVGDQLHMRMSFGKLNADIPVKAYECSPCEFSIGDSLSWGNDFSSDTENNEETSKLVINVKNVKTYFKNNLLSDRLSNIYDNKGAFNNVQNKIDSIMIYDLVENIERSNGEIKEATDISEYSSTSFTNLTVNGAKAMFLDKRVLLENEEANLNIKSYIWGNSATRTYNNEYVSTTSYHDNEATLVRNARRDFKLTHVEDNERYRGGWTWSLTTPPTYDKNKSFWGNLGDNIKNVLLGTRRLILVTGAANLQIIPNCLIDSFFIPGHVYDPIPYYDNGFGRLRARRFNPKDEESRLRAEKYTNDGDVNEAKDNLSNIQPDAYLSLDPIDEESLLRSEKYTFDGTIDKAKDNLSNIQPGAYLRLDPKDEESRLRSEKYTSDGDVNQAKDNLSNIQPDAYQSLNPSDQTSVERALKYTIDGGIDEASDNVSNIHPNAYQSLNTKVRDLPEQDFTSQDSREIPEQDYLEIEKERMLPEQEFSKLKGRHVPHQMFGRIKKERRVPEQDYLEIEKERKLKDQDFNTIEKERNLPKQEYKELDKERELIEQDYREVNKERELAKQDFKKIEKERTQPEQKFKEIEKERNTESELMELLLIARSLPGFKDMSLEDIRKLPKQDLIDLKEAEERTMPMYNADKSALLDVIKNVEGSNTKLLELDKDNKTVEEASLEMLQKNQALNQFKLEDSETDTPDEKARKLKKITAFTKEFVENSETVRKAYITNILGLKNNLKNITKDIVNQMPINDTHIIKKGDREHNNLDTVLMSQNDLDQINHNMKFLAINDNDVEKLSFQTLITLQDELGQAVQRSEAIVGLTSIAKNSIATHPDEKFRANAKNSVIEEPKKDKIKVIF